MAKPFAIEELLARIRVCLKRKSGLISKLKEEGLRFGKLVINEKKHKVTYDNNEIELTKKEFDLLKYLVENKGVVVTRDNVLEKIWGYDYIGDTNVVDVYVRYLRNKIDNRFNVKIINTVRGVGYQIKDDE